MVGFTACGGRGGVQRPFGEAISGLCNGRYVTCFYERELIVGWRVKMGGMAAKCGEGCVYMC
jgi:hypothetical protein